jgi:Large polyvalent protein-associated domain 7
MDADNSPSVRPPLAQGGTVEPANRATVAKEKFQTPPDMRGERYELRDPFAEITYRSNNLIGMVAKADQLGITRFVALDEAGQRTTVQKVGDEWHRGQQRAAAPERPIDATPDRADAPQTSKPAPTSQTPPRIEAVDLQPVTTIDAKAERAAMVAKLESALADRYLIKRAPVTVGDVTLGRTEYRFKGDTTRLAFTESTFRLATDTNSPSVARSMVDVAEARNWRALRVSGNEDFKRMVWLEASARGVKTLGYEPNSADLQVLNKEREARLVNRIEPDRTSSGITAGAATTTATTPTNKASARGGSGRKTVLAAIEAVLVAKGVPDKQREAVMAAAAEKLAQRTAAGQTPKVKLYGITAPSQRQPTMPTPDMQRNRERAAPVR